MATVNENTTSAMVKEVPAEVKVDREDGVDPQALILATKFMEKVGSLARLTRRRGDLSYLYIMTMSSWTSKEVMEDVTQQRHFKQILYALAHGLHLVRVVGDGRVLLWNKYRDNSGNELEDHHSKVHSENSNRSGRYQSGGDGDERQPNVE